MSPTRTCAGGQRALAAARKSEQRRAIVVDRAARSMVSSAQIDVIRLAGDEFGEVGGMGADIAESPGIA